MELELCKETYSCYEALPPLVETREQSTETIVPDYCPSRRRREATRPETSESPPEKWQR